MRLEEFSNSLVVETYIYVGLLYPIITQTRI